MDGDDVEADTQSSNLSSMDAVDVDEGSSVDGNYLDDEVVSSRRTPWDIITPQNIQQHQNHMLAEVSDVLACPQCLSRILLIEYNWDKTALISKPTPLIASTSNTPLPDDFVEKGRDIVFRRAGCPTEDPLPADASEGIMTCSCCFCDISRQKCTGMPCGHLFCNDCWVGHFKVQIRDGNSCRIKCMGIKCRYACSEDMICQLLRGHDSALARYRKTLLESYVNDNTNVKWCPSIPNCGNAVRNNRDECCEPTCHCGLHFCFSCLGEAHSPCTCDMWTRWERKRLDESETLNWITANTKACPKCGKLVEKNGGCNLMTCRCGQHFCWLCGGATGFDHTYHTITNHQCGRWKENMDRNIDEAACNHKRYMHYFTRWNGHRDSLKKEQANAEIVVTDLRNLCDSLNDRWLEYDALLSCVKVLNSARHVLSNSYAFAFFLCDNNWYTNEVHPEQISLNQALFEDMQQQFEGEIERLSRLLSIRELGHATEIKDHLHTILNCSRSVMRRMQNFFEAINSGLLGQLEQTVVSIADFMPYHLAI